MIQGFTLVGADVLTPEGLARQSVFISRGKFCDAPNGKTIDLSGHMVLPGIVDVHGDGFERHLAPRRGAMLDLKRGLVATESELAANGISTAILAQFYSWEGGMRGPKFAVQMFAALKEMRDTVATDMRPQLRFETHLLTEYGAVLDLIEKYDIDYVVFNDHIPHARLVAGKRPPRLTGQALKSGRSPEAHLALLHELHERSPDVPAALDGICKTLVARGVSLGSHDDNTATGAQIWHNRGVNICEFPETLDAAKPSGRYVVMGAPNIMRGGSHKGNVDAIDLVAAGACDALASDYHYPSLMQAAFHLADHRIVDFASAWRLVSSGPARILGLWDRGEIVSGLRADLTIIDPVTRRICGTITAGKISYLSGAVAARFAI